MRRLILLLLLESGAVLHGTAASDAATGPGPTQAPNATLVVSGIIVDRNELWDRRSNPLMGRPDILKQIDLVIGSLTLKQGRLPQAADRITVAIKGAKAISAFRSLDKGMGGVFNLAGDAEPFELLEVGSVTRPQAQAIQVIRPTAQPTKAKAPEFPENVSSHELKTSAPLQKKALRAISIKYAMSQARILFLTSFSGPEPPAGGYLYWGVTGKVKGKWQVWQPGYQGMLRPGQALTDPKRYQK